MTDTSEDISHLFFARKLASNDKDVRYQTVSNLGKFFTKSVNALGEVDMLKIWMGLFYAMWMSDKPVVQKELAESISQLIHTHSNPDNAFLFIQTFYTTMNKQFPNVDRLRHDKYLKLVRLFVHHSLKYIKDQGYSHEMIEKYHKAQTNVWGIDEAQEIQLHVCDLFFDELFYACGNDVPSEAIFQYASIFADTLKSTNHAILITRLFESLKALISGASYCSPKLAPKKKKGIEIDKSLFPDVEFVNVNLEELVNWFMEIASSRDQILNRNLFYQLKDEALKKQKAEPGFKLLPRGSIMKKVEETEKAEYKRLMHEHRMTQQNQPEEEIKNMSKKERNMMMKKKTAAASVNGQAVQDVEEKEKKGGKKGEKKEEKKEQTKKPEVQETKQQKKRQRVEEEEEQEKGEEKDTPAVVTTTTVVTKKQKKNAKGEVLEKQEKKVETVVIEDAKSKTTEVTTTTSVKKTPEVIKGRKGEKKEEKKEEKKAGKKADNKKESKPVEKEETEEVQEEAAEEENNNNKNKKDNKKKMTKPVPVISTPSNENGKKRKASEPDSTPIPTPVTNGKKKTEEKNEGQNGTPAPAVAAGKKGGKKENKKEEKGEENNNVTPQKGESNNTAVTPSSSGKKSVRFSKKNHVKEFDKQDIPNTPSTPSATKPKSVLATPPSSAKSSKVGKNKK